MILMWGKSPKAVVPKLLGHDSPTLEALLLAPSGARIGRRQECGPQNRDAVWDRGEGSNIPPCVLASVVCVEPRKCFCRAPQALEMLKILIGTNFCTLWHVHNTCGTAQGTCTGLFRGQDCTLRWNISYSVAS